MFCEHIIHEQYYESGFKPTASHIYFFNHPDLTVLEELGDYQMYICEICIHKVPFFYKLAKIGL